jgi:hypothetical protein
MSVATEILLSLVEAKPVMAGLVSGVASAVVLGLDANEAIMFAGTTALGVSLGDALLSGAGFATKIESYLDGGFATYFDPMDFVGAGTGVVLLNLVLGVRGQPLAVMGGVAAVAGGVAPKIASAILLHGGLGFQSTKPVTGSKGVAGETVRA